MIKKYNQFIKKTNEEFVFGKDQIEDDVAKSFGDDINSEPTFQIEEEEEGGDVYYNKLKELADALGVEVTDKNTVEYDNKQIIFPSETEMYHVDNKKFKTSQEVINYLEGGSVEGGSIHRPQLPKNEIPQEEMELELQESKSYKSQRLKKFRK
jgi:hypothetical protein